MLRERTARSHPMKGEDMTHPIEYYDTYELERPVKEENKRLREELKDMKEQRDKRRA